MWACQGGARRARPQPHARVEVDVAVESALIAAAASTAQRRPGVEVSARRERGLGPLTHTGRRAPALLDRERGDDPKAQLGVVACLGVEGPGDRGAEVVELGVETREPHRLVRSLQAGPGRFGEAGVVLSVATTMFLGVAGVVEALERVLTQGLEQAVTRGGVGAVVEDNHRLRDQVIERVADIPRRELVVSRDRGGGVGIEAPGEDPEAIEDRAIAFVEQRIGPLDRGPQRLMPLDPATPSTGEEPEPFVEEPRDLGRAHAGNPRGGELDRQRDRVEPPADLHDLLRIRRVELQPGPRGRGAIHEQPHRLTPRNRLQARLRRRRDVERRHAQQPLAGHAERLAARRQHPHPRRGAQDRLRHLRRFVQEMLAVVQHDQRLLAREEVAHALGERTARA